MEGRRTQVPLRLDRLDRAALASYFRDTWRLTGWLFSAIADDAVLYEAPDLLRHPLIFYLGHPAAFYVNKLALAGLLPGGLDPRLDELFARGVDPATADALDSALAWPSVAAVRSYRSRVFETVAEVIERAPVSLPLTPDQPTWALLMGLEHERIHLETSSVLIRQYPLASVRRPDGWGYAPSLGAAPAEELVPIEAGAVTLGRPIEAMTYGWDNEYGRLDCRVEAFEAGRFLVTNKAYMEFVADGGYQRDELWTEEGWSWRRDSGTRGPKFWIVDGEAPRYRAMFDHLDLPLGWPAEVNAHEAAAYCRWRGEGFRLPSEAEWARMTADAPLQEGDSVFNSAYNLALAFGSPTPVGYMSKARTARGIDDPFGNVWQWLSDDFHPLPGFRTHRLYADFSEPYFDSEHGMMLGGSWASSGTSASRFYRLWFRRHFFQHAGFRFVRGAA